MTARTRESTPPRNGLGVLIVSTTVLLIAGIGLTRNPSPNIKPKSTATAQNRELQDIKPGVRLGKGHYLLINPTSDEVSALRSLANQVEILQVANLPFDGEDEYRFPPEFHETIGTLHNLRTLVIQTGTVSDETIRAVLGLRRLQCVVFSINGRIGDDRLLKLATHRELKMIGLWEPDLTPNVIDRFRMAAPQIRLEIGKYNRYGDVFDGNGCLNSRFIKAWF